ncbi:TspO/MBR family protein [Nitzschia inconspicua]|uniref:TspO/MBR family protein n=1 Tax=Nitzschia inconspicua TaxID=303405 RepID=A0A9K3KLP9_9STRA|nr:TspO/MBR family protein [Nitzschia inconspicua]
MKRKVDPMFQTDPLLGWILASIYWSICLFVGIQLDYLHLWLYQMRQLLQHGRFSHMKGETGVMHLVVSVLGFAVVFKSQQQLSTRYSSFGRPVCKAANWVFGLVNGVLETFIFVAIYKFGQGACLFHLGGHTFNYPPPPRFVQFISLYVGFLPLMIYLGLIHALFWAPFVFPRHLRSEAPPFHKHALLPLVSITFAMMVPVIVWDDLVIPSIIHMYADLDAAGTMNLPGPFWKATS